MTGASMAPLRSSSPATRGRCLDCAYFLMNKPLLVFACLVLATTPVASDAVAWTAPASGNTLDWAMLHHFEFTANVAPAAATVTLIGAAISTEAELPYILGLLGP